jgi:hypothetical protein
MMWTRTVCRVLLNKTKRQARVGSEKKEENWRKKFRAISRLEKIEEIKRNFEKIGERNLKKKDRRKLEKEICGVFPQ